MITHYIIMSSSYSKGRRIVLDYHIKESKEYLLVRNSLIEIIKKCGKDVSLSTHCINTDSEDWSSVVEKDHFFKDVDVIESIDEFIKLIKIDRKLLGIDVAKYILSKTQCTHLKLEKLVYLCYADYLCKYGEKLYQDDIYAFKYGPVTKSVYEEYKKYGYEEIEKDEKNVLEMTSTLELPSKSRILFAEDGIKKVESIDITLKKYGNLLARSLVDITHRELTPWAISGKGQKKFELINDETIKKYHYNEEI